MKIGYRKVHVPQRVDALAEGNHKSSSIPGRTAYVRVLPVVNVFQTQNASEVVAQALRGSQVVFGVEGVDGCSFQIGVELVLAQVFLTVASRDVDGDADSGAGEGGHTVLRCGWRCARLPRAIPGARVLSIVSPLP